MISTKEIVCVCEGYFMAEKKANSKKKWDHPTFPVVTKAIPAGSWRAVEADRKSFKKKKANQEIVKPFQVRHYRFFPCCWSKNIKAGFKFYLLIRTYHGKLIGENDSPMFVCKQDAVAYADNNSLRGYLPG